MLKSGDSNNTGEGQQRRGRISSFEALHDDTTIEISSWKIGNDQGMSGSQLKLDYRAVIQILKFSFVYFSPNPGSCGYIAAFLYCGWNLEQGCLIGLSSLGILLEHRMWENTLGAN